MSVKTPRYIIQQQPEKASFVRRHWLMVSLMVLAVLTYLLGRYTNIDVLQAFKGQQKTLVEENQKLETENESLKVELSRWKTEVQVKDEAIRALQKMLEDTDKQQALLKQEIQFFESLLSGKEQVSELSVLSAKVNSRGDLHHVQVVLAQKLTKVREKTGSIILKLKGIKGEEGETLNLTEQFSLEKSFSLKYFQVFNYSIKVPDGFNPTVLLVELESSTNKPKKITEQFDWSKIIKN
ncbi:DUF6776 family protein [Marinicella rhabdoformis]|uniref:DUF6776 family protein n=1 Tax=Marinicella rhabdoformis TaxID=2580566 RepID=UPI0012AEC65F|nr:DUF6776 family protein [Marinicella rhabdoformis]